MLNAWALCLCLPLVLVSGAAFGQQSQSQANKPVYSADPSNVPDAVAKVKAGDFNGTHVETIARFKAVEAIPALREQFIRSNDQLTKAKIANALVRLGDNDDAYWNFLVELATPAIESDAPDFMNLDPQAKTASGPSAAYVAWAKAHNLPPGDGEDAMVWLPGKVILLASTDDRRAVPLLRRGLLNPNHMIEFESARGLAEIQDKDSIPLIINACKNAPPAAAELIARSLVYFDDADAQNAFDKYVPKDMAKVYRDDRARGGTPFNQ